MKGLSLELDRAVYDGKTREELATEFGLSTWKSLDISMRRSGFTWDGRNKTYIPELTKLEKMIEEAEIDAPLKAEQVIRKFEFYGDAADPRTIAKMLGFEDHRVMGQYMESSGFIWDSEKGNYVSNLSQKKHTKSVEVVEEKHSDIMPSGVDSPSADRGTEK